MASRTYDITFGPGSNPASEINHTVRVTAPGGFSAVLAAGVKLSEHDSLGDEADGYTVKSVVRVPRDGRPPYKITTARHAG